MGIPMSVGATTILLPDRPTPAAVLNMLHTKRPTLFFGVPTLYAAMLADPACLPENSSDRLRLCISAGEALPEDIGLTWRDRMPGWGGQMTGLSKPPGWRSIHGFSH